MLVFDRGFDQRDDDAQVSTALNALAERYGFDNAIAEIKEAIRQLMASPSPKDKRPFGFAPWEDR